VLPRRQTIGFGFTISPVVEPANASGQHPVGLGERGLVSNGPGECGAMSGDPLTIEPPVAVGATG